MTSLRTEEGAQSDAETGTYKGQWQRGLRHGYGVRTSAQFNQASVNRNKQSSKGSSASLRSDGTGDPLSERDKKMDDGRGGFVLRVRSDEIRQRRGSLSEKSNFRNVFRGLRMRRQRSTGDIGAGRGTGSIRSTNSSTSWMSTDSGHSAYTAGDAHEDMSNASFIIEDEQLDPNVTETYMGEWKNDKRNGFGACERSDGIRYEGEWYNNKKYGYGVTTFKDGSKEDGKYKNNILITSNKKKHMFLVRSAKFRERIEAAVAAAQRASKIAMQKEDIAISRTATARGKAEQADIASLHAAEDSDLARIFAKQFAPDFQQPGVDFVKSSKQHHSAHTSNNKIISSKPKEDLLDQRSNALHKNNSMDDHAQRDHLVDPIPRARDTDFTDFSHFDRESIGEEYENSHINNSYGPISSRKNSQISNSSGHNRVNNRSSSRPTRDNGRISDAILNDRFDHYNRPPSRDRSVDRYGSRGQTPVSSDNVGHFRSQAPSTQKISTQDWTPDSGVFEDDASNAPTVSSRRSSRQTNLIPEENVSLTGNGCIGRKPLYHIPVNQKEAEVLLRQRACGQEIPPEPTTSANFKRTESLYINPVIRRQTQTKTPNANATNLKRKKSLPEAQPMPANTPIMPREQASMMSSHQRELNRIRTEEAEMYRANPLLYLTSPVVQEWFSRQRLVMLILFLNLSLAFMFFKLLS